ncbi:unnamed protein product [Rotaria sordida]|uniref:Glycosyltransferase 61 catalytic domain-containing protein n=1 Tax=Rotaria sordida TaxID=392033 RepID=A0A814G4F1_9BILA|nr:unnamed protein product [Rotaria sordida]CAF1071642.1 unnamed protein product [Rotaria sordida]
MVPLKFRARKTLLWLLCSSITILTIYYLHVLLETHHPYGSHDTTLSNEVSLHQGEEKIHEANLSGRLNVQSAWTCTGNMNYESEWHQRTCVFNNICYNKTRKIFQFYRKPGGIKRPVLFEPKLGHIYDFNINNHGFVSLVTRPTVHGSWGPTIVEELLPSANEVPYLQHVHVLFMHWHVPFNPGHIIWEDIASTYFAMIRLNEYDRNAVLLEYRNFPKSGDQFHHMYENLVPAFAAKVDSLDHYTNNFSSPLVCFQTLVAGGAKPVFSIDHEPYTHGKEKLFYDYRTAILQYHGVNISDLPSRHRIVLVNKTRAMRRSLRGISNLVEVKNFIKLAYPQIQLDVIDWSEYTFTQQLHELHKTTILITPCGGISTIIPFLSDGTHAIIMDFYVNKKAYAQRARYRVGESASMDGAFLNYFPHIRKLYYQVRSAKDYVFDFPGALDTRQDASIRVNMTRLKELIDTALDESIISSID